MIYGGYTVEEKQAIYFELNATSNSINVPILLIRDFNQILDVTEIYGQAVKSLGMRNFREWIDNNALINLPLSHRNFTLSRGNSKSKIDRVLCHSDWLIKFPSLILSIDKKLFFDHAPLILSLEPTLNWGPKPFRRIDA